MRSEKKTPSSGMVPAEGTKFQGSRCFFIKSSFFNILTMMDYFKVSFCDGFSFVVKNCVGLRFYAKIFQNCKTSIGITMGG